MLTLNRWFVRFDDFLQGSASLNNSIVLISPIFIKISYQFTKIDIDPALLVPFAQ